MNPIAKIIGTQIAKISLSASQLMICSRLEPGDWHCLFVFLLGLGKLFNQIHFPAI